MRRCQFHQSITYEFSVRTLFWQLFSSYTYVEKAAKTKFIQKIHTKNADEIKQRSNIGRVKNLE
jgi:hypothetical protein